MGLIAARPEDPEEWAGIPSEPRDVQTGIDRLADAPSAGADALGLLGAGTIESIVIPVALPVHVADQEPGEPPTRD